MIGWATMQQILLTYFHARGAFRHPTPDEFFAIANEVSGPDLTWFFDAVHRSAATFDYAVAAGHRAQGRRRSRRARSSCAGSGRRVSRRRCASDFDDGSPWTSRGTAATVACVPATASPAHVATVEVDPDRVLLLDLNYTNNSWTRAAARRGGVPRSGRCAGSPGSKTLLLTYAFFA